MMKKLASKLLITFLSVLMIMSCTITAFADTTVDITKTGSISLGEVVEGSTFCAYQILDFDGETYTVNEKFSGLISVTDIVNTSASSEGTLSYGSTNELEAQISKLQSNIAGNGVEATATAETNENGELTFSGLNLGVYLVQQTSAPAGYIVSTQAFLVALPSWDQEANSGAGEWIYNITAKPKNEYLQVEKKIKDQNRGTQENGVDEDSYLIGETIPFTVTGKIPNYGQSTEYPDLTVTENLLIHEPNGNGVKKYNALKLEFSDKMDKGLTLDLNSLTLKILKTDGTVVKTLDRGEILAEVAGVTNAGVKTLVSGGKDYTATETKNDDNSTTMEVEVAWNSVDQYQGYMIQFTYNGQLNKDAAVGDANKNKVTYSFSNDPQKVTGEAEDPTRTGTTDENKVYTYEMNLTKRFNGEEASTAKVDASKVGFELYVKNSDNTTTKLAAIKTGDGAYAIWAGNTTAVSGAVTTLNPSATGSLVVKGFKDGTYELKETASVTGYSVLAEPVTILVEEVKVGNPEVVTEKVSAYTLKYANSAANLVEKADILANQNAEGKFTITINNTKKQFNLPLTGGLGLWMFTIAGVVLMAVAIISFSGLHKKKVKKG